MRALWLRLRAALNRSRVDKEMDAELADHFESEVQDLIHRGHSEADARRIAAETMGGLETLRQECRDSRGTLGWESFIQDVSFAFRMLVRKPALPLTAIGTITLGIAATTAVFSVVDQTLVRPLPFADPDRLFAATSLGMRGPFDTLQTGSRLADYGAYVMNLRSFNSVGTDVPERLQGCEVSASFFDVLGVTPAFGRAFLTGEDRNAARVVVLSHDFWVRRYGARRDVIGRHIELDDQGYEIAGVMPAWFRFPQPEADFWVPMRMDPRIAGEFWGAGGIFVLGRLRPGVTLAAADNELRAWIPRIRKLFPWRMPDLWGHDARLAPLKQHLVKGTERRSLLLFGAVLLLLIIAVVNSAGLLAARAAARERELAVRVCLGATPQRLLRQWLAEGLLVGLLSAGLGILLAFLLVVLLKHLLPPDTPRLATVHLDGRALGFTLAIGLVSSLLFGLWPAGRTRRTMVDYRGSAWADALLVAGEAAVATVLLVAAGLTARTLWVLSHVDPGFRVQSLVTAELSQSPQLRASRDRSQAMLTSLESRLLAFPGVTGVAAMNAMPLSQTASAFAAAVEDHPRPPQEPQFVFWSNAVTPGTLDILGLRLLQGRDFTAADGSKAPLVVLVSQSTAQHFWPDQSAVGRRLKPVWEAEWRTIVGVVSDASNYALTGEPDWMNGDVYLPIGQSLGVPPTLMLAIRTAPGAAGLENALPRLAAEACSGCAISRIERMERLVEAASDAPRSTAWLVGGFALLALVTIAAGVYGVVSHAVARRVKEVGIRLALGASRTHLVWTLFGSTLRSVGLGSLAGLVLAWALTHWLESLLFGVGVHDSISFAAAPLLIGLLAALSSSVPLSRAVRADPVRSLREG